MSTAFKRGWISAQYRNRKCPYPAWTGKWSEWNEGWNAYRDEWNEGWNAYRETFAYAV
jgi:hypothetical protein